MAPRRRRRKFKRRRKRRMPIVKLIKKVILSTAEHKYRLTNANSTNLEFSNPMVATLNTCPGGDSVEARVGNDLIMSHINVRYGLILTDSNFNATVRVYVIQFMSQAGPQQLPSRPIGLMPNQTEAVNLYRILYDRTHQLSLGVNLNLIRKFSIPGRKLKKADFFDNGLDQFSTGEIRIFFVTDNETGNTIESQYVSRMVFTDT